MARPSILGLAAALLAIPKGTRGIKTDWLVVGDRTCDLYSARP